jgi:hypothetical protein
VYAPLLAPAPAATIIEPVAGADVPPAPLTAACVAPAPALAAVVPVRAGVDDALPVPALPEVAVPAEPGVPPVLGKVITVDDCVLPESAAGASPPQAKLAHATANTIVTRSEYLELDITIHPLDLGPDLNPCLVGHARSVVLVLVSESAAIGSRATRYWASTSRPPRQRLLHLLRR